MGQIAPRPQALRGLITPNVVQTGGGAYKVNGKHFSIATFEAVEILTGSFSQGNKGASSVPFAPGHQTSLGDSG